MALSIFEDKSVVPDDTALKEALGKAYPIWTEIKSFVYSNYTAATEEWKHSGKNYGWGFRLRDKTRVIVYLTPGKDCFKFSVVFGAKATERALNEVHSGDIRAIIQSAPVYAEGRGFRMEVNNDKNMADIKTLILVKLES